MTHIITHPITLIHFPPITPPNLILTFSNLSLYHKGVASPPATNGTESSFDYHNSPVPYGCWFFRLAGSGIYVNVGKTLVMTQRWVSHKPLCTTIHLYNNTSIPYKSFARYNPTQISHSNLPYKSSTQLPHTNPTQISPYTNLPPPLQSSTDPHGPYPPLSRPYFWLQTAWRSFVLFNSIGPRVWFHTNCTGQVVYSTFCYHTPTLDLIPSLSLL